MSDVLLRAREQGREPETERREEWRRDLKLRKGSGRGRDGAQSYI